VDLSVIGKKTPPVVFPEDARTAKGWRIEGGYALQVGTPGGTAIKYAFARID